MTVRLTDSETDSVLVSVLAPSMFASWLDLGRLLLAYPTNRAEATQHRRERQNQQTQRQIDERLNQVDEGQGRWVGYSPAWRRACAERPDSDTVCDRNIDAQPIRECRQKVRAEDQRQQHHQRRARNQVARDQFAQRNLIIGRSSGRFCAAEANVDARVDRLALRAANPAADTCLSRRR